MNESGRWIEKELKKRGLKPENLLVVHDDSDIEIGKYKLSFGRSSAGHKGAESAIKALKTRNFWRLRIGVRSAGKTDAKRTKAGLPAAVQRAKAGDFVLKKISASDKRKLTAAFQEIISSAVLFQK